MIELSPKPIEELDTEARRTVTRLDLAKTGETLHAVQVVTRYDKEARQLMSYVERICVTEPEPGTLLTRHDPDLYATVAFYACHRYSDKELREAHADALDRVKYARETKDRRITAIFTVE